MNRRGFMLAFAGLAALFSLPAFAWAMKHYPPFVRGGLLLTPYWKSWTIGERTYNISDDEWMLCRVPHRTLEARAEATDEPDSGISPVQLGFKPQERNKEFWTLSPSTQELVQIGCSEGLSPAEALEQLPRIQRDLALRSPRYEPYRSWKAGHGWDFA